MTKLIARYDLIVKELATVRKEIDRLKKTEDKLEQRAARLSARIGNTDKEKKESSETIFIVSSGEMSKEFDDLKKAKRVRKSVLEDDATIYAKSSRGRAAKVMIWNNEDPITGEVYDKNKWFYASKRAQENYAN